MAHHHRHGYEPFSLTHVTYPIIESSSPIHRHLPEVLALLSLTPPFGVCALTVSSLLYKDVVAAYLLLGSLLSASFSSMLKKFLRQPRPPRYDNDLIEGELEYGMPSNHSTFAFFCATFVVLWVVRRGNDWAARSLQSRSSSTNNNSASVNGNVNVIHRSATNDSILVRAWHFLHNGFTIVASLFIAVGCAYSRVYLEYHTADQAYVGSAIGLLLGAIWYRLFETGTVRRMLIWADARINELEVSRRDSHSKGTTNGWKGA